MARLISIALLLVGCGTSESAQNSGGPPPALVRVAEVQAGDLTDAWSALAEVQALDDASMASGASGPVARVTVREGDRVKRGDLLVEVDLDVAGAQLTSAEAAVREASAELDRRKSALDRRTSVSEGVLAAEELSEARAAVAVQDARVASLEAAAQQARAVVGRHRMRAPFDGVVAGRYVDPGDWVSIGTPVVDLISNEAVELRVSVPLELSRRLEPGLTVTIGEEGSGELIAVVPTLDRSTRTALVRITPDPALGLTAGQTVDVALPIQWTDVGVKIPRDAVLLDPKQDRVLKVVAGAAEAVPVTVLARGETDVLVQSDSLQVGDKVVTRGNERVRPGQPLRFEGEP